MSSGSSKRPPRQEPGQDTPERRPRVSWGPAAAILYTFFLYFGGQFFASLALGLIVALTGLHGFNSDGSAGIAGQFYFVVLSDVIIVLALWLFLRGRRSGFPQLGLGRRPAVRDLAYAVAGYVVYFGLLIVALEVIGPLTGINVEQRQELGFNNLFSNADKIMGVIALVLLPPIVEETVFRGFLFTGLRTKLSFVWAALVTSLLFASPHLFASSQGLLWVAGVDTFILSCVLCYLREKTGALWAGMVVHTAKNAIAFIILVSAAT